MDSPLTKNMLFTRQSGCGPVATAAVFLLLLTADATDFSFDDRGGTSLSTTGGGENTVGGYARVRAAAGSSTPSGIAIFGFRRDGVLVSEAGVRTTSAVNGGRIFVEVDGPVRTGLAITSPNDVDAAISFFFTDSDGVNFGSGNFLLGANEHRANFLDEDPYNSGSSVFGSFTFMSSVPVSAVALRGLTNENSDFLITTLPVAPLTPAFDDTVYFPRFADGGGWATQVILVNPTDTPITGSVEFFDPGSGATPGQLMALSLTDGRSGSTFAYSIPPRSAHRLHTSNPAGGVAVGSVRIVRDAGSSSPSGVGIFSFTEDGVTVSEAGVPVQTPGSAFRLYVEASGYPGGDWVDTEWLGHHQHVCSSHYRDL